MSRLEELIAELCPDGVEYKELLYTLSQPITDGPHETPVLHDSGIPFISVESIHDGIIDKTKCRGYISKEYSDICRKKYKPETGDVYMVKSASIGRVAIVGEDIDFDIWSPLAAMRPDKDIIVPKFLFYVLQTDRIQKEVIKKSSKSSQPNLSMRVLERFRIPVPPLEVQREIVRILDSFTFLSAELSAELQARRKQYEYYRDTLLDVKINIPMVKLKDIATEMFRGSGIKRDEVTKEGIPCVRYGEIYTTYNTWFDSCVSHTKLEYIQNPKYFERGDILFAITGESIEDIAKSVAYVGSDRCLAGGDIVVMKHNQNPRYLAHVLSTTNSRVQKSKGKVKSKVVHSSIPSIENIEIPLPPLDVQERFATVLDNFEAICNDLSIGLPAEIEARQKQYEYYRDKLLTFKEKN